MERVKNIKNNFNFMKNIFAGLIMVFVLMFSANAVNQLEIIHYQFEEGSGNILIDITGNDNYGSNSNADYDVSQKIYGNYAMDFDGIGDYITTLTQYGIPDTLTFSVWADKDNNDLQTMFNIYDSSDDFRISLDRDNQNIVLNYLDTSQIARTQNICDVDFPTNTMIFFVFGFDFINNTYSIYYDGVLQCNGSLDYSVNRQSQTNVIRIGADKSANNDEYDGDMDELRIFNGYLNSSQVTQLFTKNTITLMTDVTNETSTNESSEPTIDDVIIYNLINTTNPIQNDVVNNQVTFNGQLNYQSDCDLYVDNKLEAKFVDIFAFSYDKTYAKPGTHNYFVYCEYVSNTTRFIDKTPSIPFSVEYDEKTIDFYLYDQNDQLFYGENLYIVTPCLKEFVGYYQQAMNSKYSFYFQKVENGFASFNLSYTNDYDFCVVRGQINYADDTFSKRFDLVEINKQIELGNLIVDNATLKYSFRLSDEDIYNMYEPSFWQKSWADLFNLVIALIIGGVVILLGIKFESEKIIIAGIIVLLVGMGVSTINLIGGILF